MADHGRQYLTMEGSPVIGLVVSDLLFSIQKQMLHLPDTACARLAMASHLQQVRGLSAEVRGLLRQVRGLLKSFQLSFFY